MTQTYRIILTQHDYTPPAQCHNYVVRARVGGCTVETRHYTESDAQREVERQALQEHEAKAEPCS